MANDDLPGFIDDEPRPAKPEMDKKKDPAPAPAFNPFAQTKVSLDPSVAPAGAPSSPAASSSAAPATKAAAKATAPTTGRVAKAAASEAEDGDVQPGQARDLWSCRHCGAKNKPGRDTCRACGKAPSEAVEERPWHANPLARIGLGAAAVLLILLGSLLLGGGDLELKPADLAHADRAPRDGKRSATVIALDDSRRFIAERRYAVCGRVLGTTSGPFGTTLVGIALAESAGDEAFKAIAVDTSGGEIVGHPEPAMTTFYLLPGAADVTTTAGAWLSIVGDRGYIEVDARKATDTGDTPVVRVDHALP